MEHFKNNVIYKKDVKNKYFINTDDALNHSDDTQDTFNQSGGANKKTKNVKTKNVKTKTNENTKKKTRKRIQPTKYL